MAYNCYTPAETVEIVSRAGVAKGNMRLDKVFLSAVSGGCLLSFACATALSTSSSPWFQDNAPGLIKTASALVFPYGLCMVVLTGADLCTGSFMFTTVAVLHRRLSLVKMLRHWAMTFFGNLAGSLFVVGIITGFGGVFDSDVYKNEAVRFATAKQVSPLWHQIFLRAIGANWLVCLACYLGMSGREYFSKVVGIWCPTFAFVSLGFDHVVANMFFIPTGVSSLISISYVLILILQGAAITVRLYIWKGIVPALIGNIIGGALFVGAYYWYQYLRGLDPTLIDGATFGEGVVGNRVDLGKRKISRDEDRLRDNS